MRRESRESQPVLARWRLSKALLVGARPWACGLDGALLARARHTSAVGRTTESCPGGWQWGAGAFRLSLEIQPLKKRESDKKGFSFHFTLAVDVTWVFLVNSCERGKWVGGDCLSHVCRAPRVNVHIPGERCQHVRSGGEAPTGTSLGLPGGQAERLLRGAGNELGGASPGVALGSLSLVVGEKSRVPACSPSHAGSAPRESTLAGPGTALLFTVMDKEDLCPRDVPAVAMAVQKPPSLPSTNSSCRLECRALPLTGVLPPAPGPHSRGLELLSHGGHLRQARGQIRHQGPRPGL